MCCSVNSSTCNDIFVEAVGMSLEVIVLTGLCKTTLLLKDGGRTTNKRQTKQQLLTCGLK